MLFTDFRQYREHGDRSKIVLTVLGAIFKERCDVRHFPFSWKTATLYRQILLINLINGCTKTSETSFRTFTLHFLGYLFHQYYHHL